MREFAGRKESARGAPSSSSSPISATRRKRNLHEPACGRNTTRIRREESVASLPKRQSYFSCSPPVAPICSYLLYAQRSLFRSGIDSRRVRKHRRDDLEAGNVGGRVHVQEDRGVAEELLDTEVEHHPCRLLTPLAGQERLSRVSGLTPAHWKRRARRWLCCKDKPFSVFDCFFADSTASSSNAY